MIVYTKPILLSTFPDSIPILAQHWPNVGTSVGPTLAANVNPTAFWLVEAMLAQRRQATGKSSTECIASANQIAAWCYVAIV